MEVVAAVVERDGRFLLTRRLEGTHLAGYWEFPGGKRGETETLEEALEREIREELDVHIRVGAPILTTGHSYGSTPVVLHFYECFLDGEPRPVLGQGVLWVAREDLGALLLPPADAEIVRLLVTRPRK
ncbi:MAG: (deoxy)nucleoside triphosphate pyrophosphohydrolase [Vicinamibacterales bacterium]